MDHASVCVGCVLFTFVLVIACVLVLHICFGCIYCNLCAASIGEYTCTVSLHLLEYLMHAAMMNYVVVIVSSFDCFVNVWRAAKQRARRTGDAPARRLYPRTRRGNEQVLYALK